MYWRLPEAKENIHRTLIPPKQIGEVINIFHRVFLLYQGGQYASYMKPEGTHKSFAL